MRVRQRLRDVRRRRGVRILAVAIAFIAFVYLTSVLEGQNITSSARAELLSAGRLDLPGEVDSNSPAVWGRVGGRNLLFVMTSMAGQLRRAWGRGLTAFGAAREVTVEGAEGGVWMEAILPDTDGTWYGYYHNEIPAVMCRGSLKVIP